MPLHLLAALASSLWVPDILSDNMILQQNTKVRLWGWSDPGDHIRVTASWTDTVYTAVTDSNCTFELKVQTPNASYDAQTLDFVGNSDSIHLENILIGEVFVGAGQSNMVVTLNGYQNCPIKDANRLIAESYKYPYIRFNTPGRNESDVPLEYAPNKWKVFNPENAPTFGSTGLWFAITLEATLRVPVGMILVAWGGARIEGFLPREVLLDLGENLSYVWPELYLRPMIMYNNLIWPIHRYTIKGILWYQGESSVGTEAVYGYRLSVLASHYRKIWGLGEIPFYIAQVAPYDYDDGGDAVTAALLREAQYEAQFLIPNSGVINTNDLVEPWEHAQVHPQNKQGVGRRFAWMALNKAYGYATIAADAPYFEKIVRAEGNISVYFTHADRGLSPWEGIRGFEVANESRVFEPAGAVIGTGEGGRTTVVVSSARVPKPFEVRYCFRNFQIGNLHNNRYLPVFPFRSDNWTQTTTLSAGEIQARNVRRILSIPHQGVEVE
jgi:sialate O-acetylesterase